MVAIEAVALFLHPACSGSSEIRPNHRVTAIRSCPKCGTAQRAELLEGLCQDCLGQVALGAETSEAESEEPAFEQPFGDYELLEKIAHGGMGVVFKARQVSLNRVVAVKMIGAGLLNDEQAIKRFRMEAEAAAHLQHQHIVAIHEVGEHAGQHFFSMDYVEGQSLAQVVRRNRPAARAAANYVRQIAEAIHYAHQRGILHRDLKPSNVLIDLLGQVRVTDFGLAKRVTSGAEIESPAPLESIVAAENERLSDQNDCSMLDSTLTVPGMVMGSASYMPPEQAAGRIDQITVRSDVYSLGAILYESLTGVPPFKAENWLDTIRLVTEAKPSSPRLVDPKIPRDLETITLKCLEKDSARRYGTAQELADELSRFLNGEPILARPVSAPERFWRWCRRNPNLAGAVITAVLIFLAGFAASVWQWQRAEARALDAQQNLYAADMNLAQQAITRDNYGYARAKLEAHWPRRGEHDLRGWEWRYLWRQCRGDELSTWSGHDEPVNCVAFSPDARFVMSTSIDGVIRLWDAAQQRLATSLTGSKYQVGQIPVSFTDDGRWLALVNQRRVIIHDARTMQTWRELRSQRSSALSSIAFLPGQDGLIATSSTGLHWWDLGDQTDVSVVFPNSRPCTRLAVSPEGQRLIATFTEEVQVWDITNRSRLWSWSLPIDQASSVAISGNGLVAVGDRDGNVRLGEAASGTQVAQWRAHASSAFAMTFSADSALLATGGSDQLIHLWSVTNQQRLATFKGHVSEVWSLAFSTDGRKLASGGKDSAIKYWSTEQRTRSDRLPESFVPLRFSADSRTLITCTTGRLFQCWDVETRALSRTFSTPSNTLGLFYEISSDGRHLVFRTRDQTLQVWELNPERATSPFQIDKTDLRALNYFVFSPNSHEMAVATTRRRGGQDVRATELFDFASRRRIGVLDSISRSLTYSRDGRFLAGLGSATQIEIWNVAERKRFRTFNEERRRITYLAFSPDGAVLAAASSDGVAVLWDVNSGRIVHTLTGHKEGVGRLVFSPDSRTLFSGSTDDTVKLWNVPTGQEMLTLADFGEDSWELQLSPNGSTLAVGRILATGTNSVTLYEAPSLAEIEAESKARAQLTGR